MKLDYMHVIGQYTDCDTGVIFYTYMCRVTSLLRSLTGLDRSDLNSQAIVLLRLTSYSSQFWKSFGLSKADSKMVRWS